jgi:hypothetical protein
MRFLKVELKLTIKETELYVLKFSIPVKKINFKQHRLEEDC